MTCCIIMETRTKSRCSRLLLQCSSSKVPGRVGKALPRTHWLGVREGLALPASAGYSFQHLQLSKLPMRECGKRISAWCQQPWFRLCDLRRVTQPLWACELDMGSRMLSALHASGPPAVQPGMAPLGKDKLLLMAWSLQCSVSCGAGVRRRSVTCRGHQGSLLHATACSLEDRPPLTEPCVHDCPFLDDQAWHIGPWGLVSACLHPPPPIPAAQSWSLGLWEVAAHMQVLGSDMHYQAHPTPSLPPSLTRTYPTPPGSLSLCMHVLSSHSHPVGPSAPKAAAQAFGGARSSVPSGHPAAAGACSCRSLQTWSPVTHSSATFLLVRTGGTEPGPTSFPMTNLASTPCLWTFVPCQPPGSLSSHIFLS